MFSEHGVDGFEHRNLDTVVSCKVDGGFGGSDSFGDLTQGVEGFGEVVSLAEGVAEAVVSAEFAAGGGDEVADAGDSDEGF